MGQGASVYKVQGIPENARDTHVYKRTGGIAPFERGHPKGDNRSSWPGNKASEDRKSPPPEISDRAIKMGLSKYGEIKEIQEETWSRAYRYSVANGIRIVVISLTQHIPSHVILTGYRTLISYEGQPTTCYGCNGTGHLYQDCTRR